MAKSYMAKPEEVKPQWFCVDATDKVLGRLAVKVARILMGKHKPTYTPFVDTGDYVIVVNAEKVKLTGRKREDTIYDYYTYYPGGRRVVSFERMMVKHPDQVITLAIRRMMPKNKLARKMMGKLKVYAGATHPHSAQQAVPLAM